MPPQLSCNFIPPLTKTDAAPGRPRDPIPRRLQLPEVEPHALVVGALGADAVALVQRLAGGATRGAHPLDGGVDVVDTEHRDDHSLFGSAAKTGHRGDIGYIPAVGCAARLEVHAQDRTIEGLRPRRVRKF